MYSITEQLIIWLSAHDYAASTYPPKDGDEFVTVERTGGGDQNKVDYPEIALQTWAQTDARAEEMALEIRDLLLLESKPYGVHSIRVDSGPYPFWDEDTRMPRYQTVYDAVSYLT